MMTPVPLTLLVVDDDPAHVRLLERTLYRAGIRNPIVYAGDGKNLLEWLFLTKDPQLTVPLLIILDLNMPEVDGYQVLERLKSDDRTRHMPVIVLTTTQDPQEITRCRQLDCDAFLTKPVEHEAFCATIGRLGLVLDHTTEKTTQWSG